jgi:signal transduction histidine kinase
MRIPTRLVWKLLAINLPVIGVVILVVWLAVDLLAADYFSTLMHQYNISPSETHQMFIEAVHRYMIQAVVLAIAVAALLSFLLTRTVLRPLAQMTDVSQRIAEGDYSARVEVRSRDEVGRLGESFNRMADSLETIETLRRNMVVDLAHELRTPLTSLRGYVEALGDGVVEPNKATLQVLQDELMRLVRLVESLNQLIRADAAKGFLRREQLDLRVLIGQVLALHDYNFQARNLTLETAYSNDAVHVTGDRDKLLQILSNLAQNVWQNAPEGSRVAVSTRRVGDGVTVRFANANTGIAEADLPLVFERFYRAEKSRSRDIGGAGVGLAIVKELVAAHGGKVGAAIEDGEFRVWFTLPSQESD